MINDADHVESYPLDHNKRLRGRTPMANKRPTMRKVAAVKLRASAAQEKANTEARALDQIVRAQTDARVRKIAAVLMRMSERMTDGDRQRIRRAIGDADSVRVNAPKYRRPGTQDKWSGSEHGARAQAAKRAFDAWNKTAEGKAWWKSSRGRAQRAAEPNEIYPMIVFVRLSDEQAEQIIKEQNGRG
jgi:hypothetical protein